MCYNFRVLHGTIISFFKNLKQQQLTRIPVQYGFKWPCHLKIYTCDDKMTTGTRPSKLLTISRLCSGEQNRAPFHITSRINLLISKKEQNHNKYKIFQQHMSVPTRLDIVNSR